jgi:DNA-binding NtrC family response regulator
MNEQRPQIQPILVVDDEEAILLSVDTALQMAGFDRVVTCRDSRRVPDLMAKERFELVLLDLTMPYVDGRSLLDHIRSEYPEVPVIVVTGAVDAETAVSCMKAGAFDYVVKPVEEDRLVSTVQRAVAFRELQRENDALRRHLLDGRLQHPEAFAAIVTEDPKMLSVFRYVESVAATSQPVLIRGETGVGKELVARAVHAISGRRGGFVAVNVAGLDDSVFSDTLFGHGRGAFTGADRQRPGLIEKAAGGTLFLDEIGELSLPSQVKLLRLVQEGEYLPLGMDEARTTTARIVASTNADLWRLQKEGRFRKDLNYRLRTHRIAIPPLRERLADLPLLLRHFLQKAAQALGVIAPEPSPDLCRLLEAHPFPGNIRELETLVFDAVSQHRGGELSLETFRRHIDRHRRREDRDNPLPLPDGKAPPGEEGRIRFSEPLPTLRQAARSLVEEAMRRCGGNQTAAAGLLGISQQALSKRLKKMRESAADGDEPEPRA